jgi:hypothetical protein
VTLRVPVLAPGVFAWLQEIDVQGRFAGYVRPDGPFDPPSNSHVLAVPLGALQGTSQGSNSPATGAPPGAPGVLFLPVVLQPAWVATFDPAARVWFGPTADALDFGAAGPQFTVFTVVGPQVLGRVLVFDPLTENYGWLDAAEVSPVERQQHAAGRRGVGELRLVVLPRVFASCAVSRSKPRSRRPSVRRRLAFSSAYTGGPRLRATELLDQCVDLVPMVLSVGERVGHVFGTQMGEVVQHAAQRAGLAGGQNNGAHRGAGSTHRRLSTLDAAVADHTPADRPGIVRQLSAGCGRHRRARSTRSIRATSPSPQPRRHDPPS